MKPIIGIVLTSIILALCSFNSWALKFEPINFGDMNHWVTRSIHESKVIGGKTKTVYEIAPTRSVDGNTPYVNAGGSPWGTSNVYAKVSGVTKGSNAVFPADRGGGNKCAKLTTLLEKVKVLGLINMDVMVAGAIFLGQVHEPITSTKGPYAKIEMGVPYTKRPQYLTLDYKVEMPAVNTRVKASGFGSKKTLPGHDNSVVFVFLQRRWEDAKGNIHARRVGTGGKLFTKSSPWVNHHRIPIRYGNISQGLPHYLQLRNGDNAYYARNSKGKMVKVVEEGWDDPSAVPTHVLLMISAGSGEPFVGTEGLSLYVDNVGFEI